MTIKEKSLKRFFKDTEYGNSSYYRDGDCSLSSFLMAQGDLVIPKRSDLKEGDVLALIFKIDVCDQFLVVEAFYKVSTYDDLSINLIRENLVPISFIKN